MEPTTKSINNNKLISREFSPVTKQERKVNSNIKWFTSQITNELPGPKIPTTTTSMYALSKYDEKAYQTESKIEAFKTDSRKVVKNNLFYGSHYQ